MTSEVAGILLAMLGGALIGAAYCGVLWIVVRGLAKRPNHAVVWLLSSGVARLALVAGGFLLIAGDDWRRWLACTAGFLVIRLAIVSRVRMTVRQAPHV